MSWLLRHNWLWSLLAFLLGALITWLLLERRSPAASPEPEVEEPPAEKEEVLVGARVADAEAATRPEPVVREEAKPAFSQLMEAEPTLFDHLEPAAMNGDTPATEPQMRAEVPPGRYGEGSAEAVPHQAPPDGFTIKGNAQSMLFHTPDSPYYGRTKPEVWFRTESDAERAGFTKYTRRPRKSTAPGSPASQKESE